MRKYSKVLTIILVILLITSVFTFASNSSVDKTMEVYNEQFAHDKALINKFFANSKYKISVIALSSTSPVVAINIVFPNDVSLEKRVEFAKKVLAVLSDVQSKPNAVPLNASEISYKENYVITSSAFFTYSNAYLFQRVTVQPLVAFVYAGPTENYRIRRTNFLIQTRGFFTFAKLPYGYERCSFPFSYYAVSEVYDNIRSAPSCVIYHYIPVSFSSLKTLSVKVSADIFVSSGSAGIIRSAGNGLSTESRVP